MVHYPIYLRPLPEATSTTVTVVIGFVLPVGNLPSMICSKQGVSFHVYFNFSHLNSRYNRRCTLAFRLHTPSSMFVILKFKRAHLKFTVYGRKQTSIHTHVHNAVMLVWGSLRLAQLF